MLFLEREVQGKKREEKGQKGGLSKKNNQKLKRGNVNTNFMYINYEI